MLILKWTVIVLFLVSFLTLLWVINRNSIRAMLARFRGAPRVPPVPPGPGPTRRGWIVAMVNFVKRAITIMIIPATITIIFKVSVALWGWKANWQWLVWVGILAAIGAGAWSAWRFRNRFWSIFGFSSPTQMTITIFVIIMVAAWIVSNGFFGLKSFWVPVTIGGLAVSIALSARFAPGMSPALKAGMNIAAVILGIAVAVFFAMTVNFRFSLPALGQWSRSGLVLLATIFLATAVSAGVAAVREIWNGKVIKATILTVASIVTFLFFGTVMMAFERTGNSWPFANTKSVAPEGKIVTLLETRPSPPADKPGEKPSQTQTLMARYLAEGKLHAEYLLPADGRPTEWMSTRGKRIFWFSGTRLPYEQQVVFKDSGRMSEWSPGNYDHKAAAVINRPFTAIRFRSSGGIANKIAVYEENMAFHR